MKRLVNNVCIMFEFGGDKRETEDVFTLTNDGLQLSNDIHVDVKKTLPSTPQMWKAKCLIARHAGGPRFIAIEARSVRIAAFHKLLKQLSEKFWPQPLA
jgi:hypothetical protein